MLELSNIGIKRDDWVLRNINLTIEKGEIYGIIGKSGVGKTTLLKLMGGLIDASEGHVSLKGKKLIGPSEKLIPGYEEIQLVNQDFALEPYHTVEQNIKEKVLFIIISFLLLLILHYLLAKKNLWKVFNVFLGIYFIVNIFSTRNLNIAVITPIYSIQNGYKHISESLSSDKKRNGNQNGIRNEVQKPIILIVLDEYSSPDELYKIVKDSSVYNFSNTLEKKGWEVRNSSYTYESSTIHSISSLFNFNLSKYSLYDKQNTETIVSKKMLKAALLDSLNSNGVAFNNFGIFHMGNTKPLTQLYLYPINFTEHFLIRTTYAEEKNKSGNFKFKNLIKSYGNIFEHNAYILNNLPKILREQNNNKSFTYVHLFIPHAPFYYGDEFPVKHVINFENYFLFWKFSNKKMEALLDSINKQGDYRIIITGDHGYRRNEHKENYHYSFTAFMGFDSLALKQIKSIQDIGLLINAGFK